MGVAAVRAQRGEGCTGGRAMQLHSLGLLAVPREGLAGGLPAFTELIRGESSEPRKLCWAGGNPQVQSTIKTNTERRAQSKPSLGGDGTPNRPEGWL